MSVVTSEAGSPGGGWPPAPTPAAPRQQPADHGAPPAAHAVIGDQLLPPMARCEAGACGMRFEDPAALGDTELRARAIAAGWREDWTGLLTCPSCQRRAPFPGAFRPVRASHRANPGDGGAAPPGPAPLRQPPPAAMPPGPAGPGQAASWPGAFMPARHSLEAPGADPAPYSPAGPGQYP